MNFKMCQWKLMIWRRVAVGNTVRKYCNEFEIILVIETCYKSMTVPIIGETSNHHTTGIKWVASPRQEDKFFALNGPSVWVSTGHSQRKEELDAQLWFCGSLRAWVKGYLIKDVGLISGITYTSYSLIFYFIIKCYHFMFFYNVFIAYLSCRTPFPILTESLRLTHFYYCVCTMSND